MAESSIRSSESSIPKKGGYDLDFVDKVLARYKCPICDKPLHKPHVTNCCGKHFCETCLQSTWTHRGKRNESCPHCGTKVKEFNHFVNQGLQNEISKLKVRCIYRRDGCKWEGKLEDLNTHLNNDSRSDISEGCGYVEVNCPNYTISRRSFLSNRHREVECNFRGKRKDLKHHLKNDCKLRDYRCDYCGHIDNYNPITSKHYKECVDYPVVCPNDGCNEKDIQRKNLEAHRSSCRFERVECLFKELGCNVNVPRHQYDHHMTDRDNVKQHNLQVITALQDLKKRVEKVEEIQSKGWLDYIKDKVQL